MRYRFTAFSVAAVVAFITASDAAAQGATQSQTLTLPAAIEMAQRQGSLARAARHTLDAARATDRANAARLLPQVFLSGDLPQYNRSIIQAPQPDGSVQFRSQQQTSATMNLFVQQAIPLTGGTLSLQSQLAQLKRTGAPETWNSTPFSVQLQQPIMQPNTLAWNRAEQDLNAELSERVYRESLEDVAGTAAAAFINAYAARALLRNATATLERNERLKEKVDTRYRVGGVSMNDVRQVQIGHLRAQQAVAQATLARDEADATLRAELGLPTDANVDVVLPEAPPAVTPDTTVAIAAALRYRSNLVQHELTDTRGRRAESEAKYNNGLNASVIASYGYNATAPGFGDVYSDLLDRQFLRVNLQFPIWQWGAGGDDRAAARASLAASAAVAQNERDRIRREVTFTIRRLTQSQQILAISVQADSLAGAAAQSALIRYDFGSIPIENVFLALNDSDQAAQQRIVSLATYWAQFYLLRRATMYDFESGQPIR